MTALGVFLTFICAVMADVSIQGSISKYIFGEVFASVHAITSSETIPSCETRYLDSIIMFKEVDKRPGVGVLLCEKPRNVVSVPLKLYNLTMCMSVFHSKLASKHTYDWFRRWKKYYTNYVGVEHYFTYFVDPDLSLPALESEHHTWIDISWVNNLRRIENGPLMWYSGQYWTINDCLYRNKELGTRWVIFQDLDELWRARALSLSSMLLKSQVAGLQLSQAELDEVHPTVNMLLQHLPHSIDALFLGSVRATAVSCSQITNNAISKSPVASTAASLLHSQSQGRAQSSSDLTPRPPPPPQDIQCTLPQLQHQHQQQQKQQHLQSHPDGRGKISQFSVGLCNGWRGRRKFVARVDRLFMGKVHKLIACGTIGSEESAVGSAAPAVYFTKNTCRQLDLHANNSWFDHYRGAPFENLNSCWLR